MLAAVDSAKSLRKSITRDLATRERLRALRQAQTQAKLNTTEKLDVAQASLKAKEDELVELRKRVLELETRLSKEQRQLLAGEAQYRDQLTERNTLLLTIYQYMDKILGVDKTPVSLYLRLTWSTTNTSARNQTARQKRSRSQTSASSTTT